MWASSTPCHAFKTQGRKPESQLIGIFPLVIESFCSRRELRVTLRVVGTGSSCLQRVWGRCAAFNRDRHIIDTLRPKTGMDTTCHSEGSYERTSAVATSSGDELQHDSQRSGPQMGTIAHGITSPERSKHSMGYCVQPLHVLVMWALCLFSCVAGSKPTIAIVDEKVRVNDTRSVRPIRCHAWDELHDTPTLCASNACAGVPPGGGGRLDAGAGTLCRQHNSVPASFELSGEQQLWLVARLGALAACSMH
jgi:hypothetical protein